VRATRGADEIKIFISLNHRESPERAPRGTCSLPCGIRVPPYGPSGLGELGHSTTVAPKCLFKELKNPSGANLIEAVEL